MNVRKKALLCSLVASMIVVIFATAPVYAETTIYAPTIVDEGIAPGTTLVIDINVSDVTNLWGWEFELYFDPTVLEPVAVYDRDYDGVNDSAITPEPYFSTPWGTPIIAPGLVYDAYSGPLGASEGFTTIESKRIATVTFTVLDWGGSYLDLEKTVMSVIGLSGPWPHTVVDGYFANVVPERLADLVKRKAWPEFHTWRLSKHTSMSLYARVKNLGSVAVKVQAWFTVIKGIDRIDFSSDVVTISSGTETTLQAFPSIEPYLLFGYGTYDVTAYVWYDSDGDGTIDTKGATPKTFSFVFKA